MFDKFDKEDLIRIEAILRLMKETGTDINSIVPSKDNKESKMKEFKDTAWTQDDWKPNKEEDKFYDNKWNEVLENRKNNPQDRWMKNEGKKATEEDLKEIERKMKEWEK